MREKPLYHVIAKEISDSIKKGAISPNTKLPSIRRLADQYGVSNLTAMNAMRLLENELIVYAVPKKGYFVKSSSLIPTHSTQSSSTHDDKELLYRLLSSGNECGLSLANGRVDLYPIQRISKIMRKLIYQNPMLLGGHISGYGNQLLTKEIIRRAIEYGCSLSQNEMCITNGGLESLSLALKATTSPGDTVIVQSPTYFYTLKFISDLGLKSISVTSLEELQKQLKQKTVAAIVYNANFNNPDGKYLSETQKKQLVSLSEQYKFTIIEDDVYGDIHYIKGRPKPLRAYSSNVILCNSFTKSIAPGLRIGWVAGSTKASTIQELKQSTSKFTAEFPQAALAEFLRSGGYDLHMRNLRSTLLTFRNDVRNAILRNFPKGTNVSTPEGGFVLWVELPKSLTNISTKMEKALQGGSYFIPGNFFSLDDEYNNCLRINFGFGLTQENASIIRKLGTIFCD